MKTAISLGTHLRRTLLAALLTLGLWGPARADEAADEREARALVDEVSKDVAAIRGLEMKKPVPLAFVTGEEIEKFLDRDLERQWPKPQLEADERAFKVLGLLPAGYALRSGLVALYREQAAGLYDPETKRMLLMQGKARGVLTRAVLAHELAHALQDQHYGLRRILDASAHTVDRDAAVSMLIEGDATAVMTRYLMEHPVNAAAAMQEALGAGEGLDAAPPFMRRMLLGPYLYGQAFVGHFLGGDWKRIDEIYGDFPLSTEQLMHPKKYYPRRDFPQRIDLPGLAAAPAGFRRCDTSLGELGVLGLVESWGALLGDEALGLSAMKVASGWDGDRLAQLDGTADAFTVAWISTWDTPEDAGEMAHALGRWAAHWAAEPDAEGLRAAKLFRPAADGKPGTDVAAVFVRVPRGATLPEVKPPPYGKTVVRAVEALPKAD